MIKIENISKTYHGKIVFDNYSNQIEDGRCTMIAGASGCGKTTLLRLLAGLELPDGGTISGMDGKIGMIFQEDRLCDNLDAVENVELVFKRVNRQCRSRIEDALMQLGLGGSLREPVGGFSGGMKRRVAIARAFLAENDVLLLDEPFTGLDEENKSNVIAWMNSRQAGRTLIVASHDFDDAQKLMCGERVIRLHRADRDCVCVCGGAKIS